MKIRITIYLFIPKALIFYHRLDTVLGNWDITRNKLEEEEEEKKQPIGAYFLEGEERRI